MAETPYRTWYKSVGLPEWRLIVGDGKKRFAPEILTGRIFYPSMLFDYACQLARSFNAENAASEYAGLVVAFDLPPETFAEYEKIYAQAETPETAKSLWLDSPQMREINAQIIPYLRVVESFYGANRHTEKFSPQEFNACGFL